MTYVLCFVMYMYYESVVTCMLSHAPCFIRIFSPKMKNPTTFIIINFNEKCAFRVCDRKNQTNADEMQHKSFSSYSFRLHLPAHALDSVRCSTAQSSNSQNFLLVSYCDLSLKHVWVLLRVPQSHSVHNPQSVHDTPITVSQSI